MRRPASSLRLGGGRVLDLDLEQFRPVFAGHIDLVGRPVIRDAVQDILAAEDRRKADVLNGIAYDKASDKIYVTGKYWPKLFEIRIKDPAAAKPQ